MIRDYLKVRATIKGIKNKEQIVMCNRLIKFFHRKWKQEGHDKAIRLKGFLGGIVTEKF